MHNSDPLQGAAPLLNINWDLHIWSRKSSSLNSHKKELVLYANIA